MNPSVLYSPPPPQTLDLNKKLNCCTGILLESFDQLKTVASNKEGLLYGVPVSIKENIAYKVFCSYVLPVLLQDGDYSVRASSYVCTCKTVTASSQVYCVSLVCSFLTLLFFSVFISQHKNYDSSCGLIIKLDQPEDKDSVIVEVLKRQGAIPFVKTNLPQGLLKYVIFLIRLLQHLVVQQYSITQMAICDFYISKRPWYSLLICAFLLFSISSYDCGNPIYGQTVNPCNLQKTPGGSSGGEGALIGGGGSLLGIGTDIGGSVRIPSAFCGICGFKATSGRLRWFTQLLSDLWMIIVPSWWHSPLYLYFV